MFPWGLAWHRDMWVSSMPISTVTWHRDMRVSSVPFCTVTLGTVVVMMAMMVWWVLWLGRSEVYSRTGRI